MRRRIREEKLSCLTPLSIPRVHDDVVFGVERLFRLILEADTERLHELGSQFKTKMMSDAQQMLVQRLVKTVREKDPIARAKAATALAYLGPGVLWQLTYDLATTGSGVVARRIAEALGILARIDSSVVPTLLDAVKRSSSPDVQEAFRQALAATGAEVPVESTGEADGHSLSRAESGPNQPNRPRKAARDQKSCTPPEKKPCMEAR